MYYIFTLAASRLVYIFSLRLSLTILNSHYSHTQNAKLKGFNMNNTYYTTRTIVGTMLWMEYRPVIKIGPKGALGSHEIRLIHSAPSLGQSIPT